MPGSFNFNNFVEMARKIKNVKCAFLMIDYTITLACTVSNKRTGWKICQEIINAQDLINAQAINKTNMTYKVKKRTGWEIFLKLINAQCLISSHRTDFFLKKK